MSDVTQLKATLERFITCPKFGSHIVSAQVIASAGMQPCLLLNGDTWRLSTDPETQASAEVALVIPMLNESTAPIYTNLWIESAGDPANDLFFQCWKDSPAEHACVQELRNALLDVIEEFRLSAAQIAAEEGRRNTEKLIA